MQTIEEKAKEIFTQFLTPELHKHIPQLVKAVTDIYAAGVVQGHNQTRMALILLDKRVVEKQNFIDAVLHTIHVN